MFDVLDMYSKIKNVILQQCTSIVWPSSYELEMLSFRVVFMDNSPIEEVDIVKKKESNYRKNGLKIKELLFV